MDGVFEDQRSWKEKVVRQRLYFCSVTNITFFGDRFFWGPNEESLFFIFKKKCNHEFYFFFLILLHLFSLFKFNILSYFLIFTVNVIRGILLYGGLIYFKEKIVIVILLSSVKLSFFFIINLLHLTFCLKYNSYVLIPYSMVKF